MLDGMIRPTLPPFFLAEVIQIPEHYLRALAFRDVDHPDSTSRWHVKPHRMISISLLGEKFIYSGTIAFIGCRGQRRLTINDGRSENCSAEEMDYNHGNNR
jgi:hypothetical protein